jgi:hypothetical protein
MLSFKIRFEFWFEFRLQNRFKKEKNCKIKTLTPFQASSLSDPSLSLPCGPSLSSPLALVGPTPPTLPPYRFEERLILVLSSSPGAVTHMA